MKKLRFVLPLGVLLMTIVSCGVGEEHTEEVAEVAQGVESKDYTVVAEESLIKWNGEGVGHGHHGTIQVKSGSFTLENDKVVKGEVVADMTTLKDLDYVESGDTASLAKLEGHLHNPDFFHTTDFPTSTVTITDGSDMNNVKADLTIKGVTEPVTFALSTKEDGETLILTTKFNVDRTKYGITYNSGNFFENLGDYLVEDEFTLDVTIVAK